MRCRQLFRYHLGVSSSVQGAKNDKSQNWINWTIESIVLNQKLNQFFRFGFTSTKALLTFLQALASFAAKVNIRLVPILGKIQYILFDFANYRFLFCSSFLFLHNFPPILIHICCQDNVSL